MSSKFNREYNLLSIEVIAKLAKAFEVSADFLLTEGQHATSAKDGVKQIGKFNLLRKIAYFPQHGYEKRF